MAIAVGATLACAVAVVLAVVLAGGSSSQPAWSAPEPIPVPEAAVPGARVTIGPDGGVHAIWAERRGGASALRAIERSPAGSLGDPQPVVVDRSFGVSPLAVAAGEGGEAAALWIEEGGRRGVLMAAVRSRTGDWTPAQVVSRVRARPEGDLVVGPDGAVTVVGRGLDGPGLWAVRWEAVGGWSAPQRIAPGGLGVDAPALAIAADGTVAVAALAKRPGRPARVLVATAGADGRWAPAVEPAGSEGARRPALALGDDGGLAVTWLADRRRRTTRLMAATRPAGGSWSEPWILDERPIGQLDAASMASAAGEPLAVWSRWEGAPEERRASVRAARPLAGRDSSLVAEVLLPRPAGSSGPDSSVIYLSPPLLPRAGGGPLPSAAWTSTPGAALSVSVDSGGWTAPDHLGGGPGSALVLAAASTDQHVRIVWAAAPPGTPANQLLVAQR